MNIKEQVSPEQWKTLLNGVSAASAYISTASGGGFESIKEILNASKYVRDLAVKESGSGYGALADELLDTMQEMSFGEARESAFDIESRDVPGMRSELKQIVNEAAALADAQPDGAGYKRFLLDVARTVAETRTGGFLGIGAKSVIDPQEQAALDELGSLLNV